MNEPRESYLHRGREVLLGYIVESGEYAPPAVIEVCIFYVIPARGLTYVIVTAVLPRKESPRDSEVRNHTEIFTKAKLFEVFFVVLTVVEIIQGLE